MSKAMEIISEKIPDQEKANELMEKLFVTASPSSVFSEPVESGEYQVITASEVSVGLGYGYGGGGGLGNEEAEVAGEKSEPSVGYGAGGGGGGGALARPVAVIEIGPNGVRIEPIVDPTKIALAFFTTLISFLGIMAKARRR